MARRTFVKGTRRLTQWSATSPVTAYTALAAATAILDSVFVTSGNSVETVVRIRGVFNVQSDQITAQEEPFGAFGVCVVSDQAVAIGVTAIPTPHTDPESDLWLLHQYWSAPMVTSVDARGVATFDREYVLDSKAMRRVSEDQSLAFVVENGSSAFGAEYRLDARVLSKLA